MSGTILGQVRLAGRPESFQLEQTGQRAFVNVPSANQLVVVDRVTMRVIATWPVTTARANYPLALDERGQRLFVGCRHPAKVLVYNTSSGTEIGAFDTVGDTDDLFFDATRERLYVSGGEGFIDVFDTRPDRPFARIARITTAPGARTSLYVPELNPAAAGRATPGWPCRARAGLRSAVARAAAAPTQAPAAALPADATALP